MKTIALLGSTGSIGKNVLNVVRTHPEKYQIAALTAGNNIDLLAQQVIEFSPEIISIANPARIVELKQALPEKYHAKIAYGDEGNCAAASLPEADIVVSAVVGSVGLLPALAAIHAGKDIGLANKETLVMAGQLVMEKARLAGINILPIDSEHSAIFQSLEAGRRQDLNRILLTASGGPFRQLDADALHQVTPEMALAHPNWNMGRKISIDSATLMNKGLEVIEARWLFDVMPEQIEVLVHPQSIVHSLVEYRDGSVIAQLGIHDMQLPIAYALSYPKRLNLDLPFLNLIECGTLTFESPDITRFPALQMSYDALQEGGLMPAVMNAANEIAVDAFLQRKIHFMDIQKITEQALAEVENGDPMDLEAILHADQKGRESALSQVQCLQQQV